MPSRMPDHYRLTREHLDSLSALAPYTDAFNTDNDICLGRSAPIFLRSGGDLVCKRLTWGISVGDRTILTTKAERTERHKKTLVHGRCLIPVSGWYEEFRTTARELDPMLVQSPDGNAMCVAGLWTARQRSAVSMLTAPAGAGTLWLHARVPVVVPADKWTTWLADGLTFPQVVDLLSALVGDARRRVFRIYPTQLLIRHIVVLPKFGKPRPWWRLVYHDVLRVLHRRQFASCAELAAELAVCRRQALGLLRKMRRRRLVDVRPYAAAGDLELWALPVQEQTAANMEAAKKRD